MLNLELAFVFSSPEPTVLRVSYCDRSLSVVVCHAPSVNFLVLKVSFCDGPFFVVHRPSVRASTISLNNISSETTYWILTKLHRNDPLVVPYQSCSNRSSWLHKQVTGSKNRFSKCNFQKSETTRPRAFTFGLQHHLEVLYHSCSNYTPGVKIDPAPGVTILH